MSVSLTSQQRDEARAALPHGPGVLEMPPGNPAAQQRGMIFINNAAAPEAGQDNMLHVTDKPSSAAATPNLTYDPHLPMDPQEYSRFIYDLNRKLDESPVKGNVHIIDLSKYRTEDEILAATQDFYKNKPAYVRDELAKRFTESKEVYHEVHKFSVSSPNWDASNPDYASLVLPPKLEETSWSLLSAMILEKGINTDAWKSLPSTSFAHHWMAGHEAYHGINGFFVTEHGETRDVIYRRGETAADTFSVLYLAQQNEPDLDRQLQSLIQFRNSYTVLGEDLKHNSGDALQQLAKELPSLRNNPDFHKWSIGELVAQADQHARTSLKKDYPHLYNDTNTDATKASNATDSVSIKLHNAARYARLCLIEQEAPGKLDHIDTRQAVLLLRASEAINAITGNSDNGLAKAVKELSAEHPQVFKEAEQELGITPHTEPSSGQKHSKGIAPAKKVGTNSIQKPSFAPLDPFG